MAEIEETVETEYSAAPLTRAENGSLLRALVLMTLPVLGENLLHILVGINDTWLANHLHKFTSASMLAPTSARTAEAAAAAAVGTITYVLWFVGLLVGAVGTGSTAIIARATGAKHRSLANSICGQSVTAAVLFGCVVGVGMWLFSPLIANVTGLNGQAYEFALSYIRVLGISLPFFMTMLIANSCMRGAGDTLSPATTMIVVDLVNMAFSFGLTYGWFGLPKLGFDGIAAGTVIAYIAGGVIQFVLLWRGVRGIKLHLHRMRPHWNNLVRLLRIGVPAGLGDSMQFGSNFAVLFLINKLGAGGAFAPNVVPAAHTNTIRIESFSYMTGFAISVAAATLVGQSLGMKDLRRAGWLAYACGAACMSVFAIVFIFFGHWPARLMSDNADVIALTTRCLFITGFCQPIFAGTIVFSGALRGAGDTVVVTILNMSSIILIRLGGAYFVVRVLGLGLPAIWVMLASDLTVRGILMMLRFRFGGWKTIRV